MMSRKQIAVVVAVGVGSFAVLVVRDILRVAAGSSNSRWD